jgi:hypothetical protein
MIQTLLNVAFELAMEQHARGSHDHDSRIADLVWLALEHHGPFDFEDFKRWTRPLTLLWLDGFLELPEEAESLLRDYFVEG